MSDTKDVHEHPNTIKSDEKKSFYEVITLRKRWYRDVWGMHQTTAFGLGHDPRTPDQIAELSRKELVKLNMVGKDGAKAVQKAAQKWIADGKPKLDKFPN